MTEAERAFSQWLNKTFNDYYVVYSNFFDEPRVVEHSAPTIHHAFFRLLCQWFPCLKDNAEWAMISRNSDSFTFVCDGVQITIKPFDDEIYHTNLIKETI